MKKLYGAPAGEISARERENAKLARTAAREGFVLLKNNGVLPLKAKRIALYGTGARKTVKGGTGSGAVQERRSVSIAEGLEKAGFVIATNQYLDDYDEEFDAVYKKWHANIDEKTVGMPIRQALGMVSILGAFRRPSGRLITREDITTSSTDTAVYIIARQAGEGKDRELEPGDWYLTETEKTNLQTVAAAYANTALVINAGGQIDLSFLDEIQGIGALVFYAQGGMGGGSALADLFGGSHSFCGKLADTWAMKYEDIPFAKEYSHLNGNLNYEYYREGIYVGYRYFDTFGVQPRYPFGFGLSYTTFSVDVKTVALEQTRVSVRVCVTNTGNRFAGKEVVQVYLSRPHGRFAHEAQSLVAFQKTAELAPGGRQTLDVDFDMADAAFYCEADSVWMLEAGDYTLRVGSSSRDTKQAAVLSLPKDVLTKVCRKSCAPDVPVEEILSPAEKGCGQASAARLLLNPDDFITERYAYEEPDVRETGEESRLLDSLNEEELVSLVKGADIQARHPDIHGALGTTGRTSIELRGHGVGNVAFCDGPAGLNIIEHVILDESGMEKPTSIPEKYNFGSFRAMAKVKLGTEGTHVYRYATAWPVELLLAQTWDTDLLEQVGDGMGQEMEEFGVTLLLAPGMNIHRNPLCGRNFEYFSEDPLLTGKLAAAQIRGAQSHKGIGLTVKHFCCNNQEDNRNGVSSNVNERALREIYLRGFQIAVREGRPLALMTSYNKLNGVYTANRHDLDTDILRCEWGFQGIVMTDWNSCDAGHVDPARCVPAGTDLVMPGTDHDRQLILAAARSGEISKEALRRSAARVLHLVLSSGIQKGNGAQEV